MFRGNRAVDLQCRQGHPRHGVGGEGGGALRQQDRAGGCEGTRREVATAGRVEGTVLIIIMLYKNLFYNSPSIRLSLFENCRSQFLLDRLARYLKLIVSTVIPLTSLHLNLA